MRRALKAWVVLGGFAGCGPTGSSMPGASASAQVVVVQPSEAVADRVLPVASTSVAVVASVVTAVEPSATSVAPPRAPRFVEGHTTCPVPDGYDRWSWKRLHRVAGLEEKALVFTLDVGARVENLLAILDLLRERDVKTTIFLYTGELERNPRRDAVLLRMVEDGHELANHTLSHKDLTTMLDSEVREQLDRVETLVAQTTGLSVKPFFREPFLATNPEVDRVIRESCYRSIWFTVDTSDWREGMTPSKIEDAVFLDRGRPREFESGSIFIFHGSQRANLEALPRIIDRLRAQGWSFLRLGDALRRAASTPDASSPH